MMKKIHLLIVDDDDLIREGLSALLATDGRFTIVAEAGDGDEAVALAQKHRPHIVLMDLAMPGMDGAAAISEIKTLKNIKVMALTAHKKERYIRAALNAGVDGYLLKTANSKEVVRAMEIILEGHPYFCPEVQAVLLEFAKQGDLSKSQGDRLTPREREVLILVAQGFPNAQIAQKLFISVKTVEKHKNSIRRKLNMRSTAELTAYCLEQGLLD